ncbi:MAG: ABC transporter permease [Gemmatimonadaceae bacterium]
MRFLPDRTTLRTPLLERLFAGHHDMLAALRSLRRSPGFVAIAVLSLGLAIGLNTTMLSMIDAIINPYVPYAQPERLFDLVPYGMTRDKVFLQRPMYLAVRARKDLYADLVPYDFAHGVTEANGHLVSTFAITTGTRLFDVLGVKPVLGRVFDTTRDDPADAAAAVIGYQLWQEDFGGAADLPRLHLTFSGRTYSVIGVMAPAVNYPFNADLWLAMPRAQETSADGADWVHALVRLKPGDTRARVRTQLDAIAGQVALQYVADRSMFAYRLDPLVHGHGHPAAGTMVAALVSILVLIVACLNLANLMLVRGLSRRRELAVRLALGSSRGAIMRHVFVEAGILSAIGGLWGVLLSVWGVKLAERHMPTMIRQLGFVTPHVSWRVVSVGVLVTAATMVIAGLAPAIHASRANVSDAMKDGGSASTGRRGRLYRLVVVAEIAVALVVMIGATFAMNTWRRESGVTFSYDAEHVVWADVRPRRSCDSLNARQQFWIDMTQRVAAVNGVRYAAAFATQFPLANRITSDQPGSPIQIVLGRGTSLGYTATTPDYFRVYGYPIVAGRDFEPGDGAGAGAAIVNRALAAKLWPFMSPVGRLLKLGPAASNAPWIKVVGVVGPQSTNPDSTDDGTPFLTVVRHLDCRSATVAARTTIPPTRVSASVYHVVRAAVPSGGLVTEFRSPRVDYDEGLRMARLTTLMFVVFGAFAVLLSAMGVYGVLGYAVGQRHREFAMRTALGAQPPNIAHIVVREAMEMVLGGTALGAIGALIVAFSAFEGAHGFEGAVALVIAEVVVILASFAACIIPIRRAVCADPVELLRAT